MTRLRHNNISTTLKIYVAENQLLNQAQHDGFMRRRNGQSEPTGIAAAEAPQTNIMSEMDAMKLLKEYRFTVKALRKYAQIQNAIETRNGKHFYSLDLVERLASNYFTKQETMRLIDCKKSAMHEWIQNQGIEVVVVGKTSLVPKDDVMRRVRR